MKQGCGVNVNCVKDLKVRVEEVGECVQYRDEEIVSIHGLYTSTSRSVRQAAVNNKEGAAGAAAVARTLS